jgi:hypothetical protein
MLEGKLSIVLGSKQALYLEMNSRNVTDVYSKRWSFSF